MTGLGFFGGLGNRLTKGRGVVSRGHLREGPIAWWADLPNRSGQHAQLEAGEHGVGGDSVLVLLGVWPRTNFKSATSFKLPRERPCFGRWQVWEACRALLCFCAGPGPCLLGTAAKGIHSPWQKSMWWGESSTQQGNPGSSRSQGEVLFFVFE